MATSEHKQTAVLFFSRSPQEEVNAKKLTFRRSRAGVRLLLKHSLRQARKTKLPLYTCYSAQQRGKDFGERLANALEDVFSAGHQSVLIIGNDSPGLSTKLLRQAAKKLRTDQLVLGPATDGGVYLIGIHTDIYVRRKFLALAWETQYLQNSWQAYVNQISISSTCLPELIDIDTARDFWQYVRQSSVGLLGKKLKACLCYFPLEKIVNALAFIYFLPLATMPPPRRGPPQ